VTTVRCRIIPYSDQCAGGSAGPDHLLARRADPACCARPDGCARAGNSLRAAGNASNRRLTLTGSMPTSALSRATRPSKKSRTPPRALRNFVSATEKPTPVSL
jgi:hypothetical protein